MIRELRVRHRRIMAGLALCLPIGLGVALAARAGAPVDPREDPAGSRAVAPRGEPLTDTVVRSGAVELRVRTWKVSEDAMRVLELTPMRALELPDVLVYWADADTLDELPSNGVLLGSLAGVRPRVFRWHPDAGARAGRVYLYSLARQELAATLEVPR